MTITIDKTTPASFLSMNAVDEAKSLIIRKWKQGDYLNGQERPLIFALYLTWN